MTSESKTVGQYTEKELIERIASIIGKPKRRDILIGIGDDTAVVKGSGDSKLLYTSDMLVEEIHFDRSLISPRTLGRRAMAVNLSDLAAMGAEPQYALVSLALQSSYPMAELEELYAGMVEMGNRFKVTIIGGNLSSTGSQMVIDLFLVGCTSGRIFTRSGAKVGDDIYVTGTLGGAHAGWLALEAYGNRAEKTYAELVKMHQEPIPRIKVSRLLADTDIVTSMTDISDGLSTDLTHICSASHVGANILWSQLPIHDLVHDFENMTGADTRLVVLDGGEDYELLFTARPGSAKALAEIARRARVPITAIGRIVPRNSGIRLVEGEKSSPIEAKGWSHFGAGNR